MPLKAPMLAAVTLAALILLAACFGGGGNEASAPGTSSKPTASARTTAAAVTVTATESNTVPTTTEAETVTGLADVPTTTERVGTDVLPKSAPPWHQELSVCEAQTFSVVYNRDLPAILVKRADGVITWAGLYRRDVSDECRDVPRKRPSSVSGGPPEGIYESVDVRCHAPRRILIDTRPVELHGSVNGSIVSIWDAGNSPAPRLGTTDWLVTAIVVNEVEGRRVYVNDQYCARG